VVPPSQSEVTLSPGASRSTQEPQFENVAKESVLSLAATVMAEAALAGDKLQASVELLPAAAM
jgi:hypothetical protein